MRLAIIIHRWGGNPNADWYPWLKAKLMKRGYTALVPAMPLPDEPAIGVWVSELKAVLQANPADELLLVGHSVGCQTILRTLAKVNTRVAKAIFVAGWFELAGLTEEELAIANPWLREPFDVLLARQRIGSSVAFFSSDDPVVPLSNQEIFQANTGSAIVTLAKYGHFDEDAHITQIPELLRYI